MRSGTGSAKQLYDAMRMLRHEFEKTTLSSHGDHAEGKRVRKALKSISVRSSKVKRRHTLEPYRKWQPCSNIILNGRKSTATIAVSLLDAIAAVLRSSL
jgi:hypothetical protein